MAKQSLSIPWGKEQMQINLPETWQVSGVLEPASLPPAADPLEEARRSLAAPVGLPRLGEIYRTGMKVDPGDRRRQPPHAGCLSFPGPAGRAGGRRDAARLPDHRPRAGAAP